MKKVSFIVVAACLIGLLAGCGNSTLQEEQQETGGVSVSESTELSEEGKKAEDVEETQENMVENTVSSSEQEKFGQGESEQAETPRNEQMENDGLEAGEMSILMKINEEIVTVAWEENESVKALKELLEKQSLTIQMSMYGGFEQVGSLGTSLPRADVQTTTQAGDIVLYSGNQMVVFYGSNSWAYTRFGRITDKSSTELTELLGNGDVIITLELTSDTGKL